MDFKEYQEQAGRTRNKNGYDLELANYSLGMVCEAGEVGDILKKHVFHKHILDIDEVKKEMGDVMWYLANLCNVLYIDMEEVAEMNINKLKARYPEGFSTDDSINRKE